MFVAKYNISTSAVPSTAQRKPFAGKLSLTDGFSSTGGAVTAGCGCVLPTMVCIFATKGSLAFFMLWNFVGNKCIYS